MTPTEQDKELEKKLMDLFCKTEQFALEFFGGKTSKEEFARNNSSGKTLDHQQAAHTVMQLITADRKRAVLEARIDELTKLRRMFERLAEYSGHKEQVMSEYDDHIAELKAQQEEV